MKGAIKRAAAVLLALAAALACSVPVLAAPNCWSDIGVSGSDTGGAQYVSSNTVSESDADSFIEGWEYIDPYGYNNSDDLYIDTHKVEMQLHRDRSISVRETLDVYFNSYDMHGITRSLPSYSSAEMFEIRDFRSIGNDYHTSGDTYYFGTADKTVHGLQHYVMTYTVATYEDTNDGFDRFYRDLLGGEGSYTTYNFVSHVALDDGLTFDSCDIYSGSYGSTGNDYAAYLLTDTDLYVYNTEVLVPYVAITADARLPEGAFDEPALLQPDLIVNSLDVTVDIDKYGYAKTTAVYKITAVKDNPSLVYRSFPEGGSRVNGKVRASEISVNGEPLDGDFSDDSIIVNLPVGGGESATVVVSREINYYVSEGESGVTIDIPLTSYSALAEYKCESISVTLNTENGDLSDSLVMAFTGDSPTADVYGEAKYWFETTKDGGSAHIRLNGGAMPVGELSTLRFCLEEPGLLRAATPFDTALPAAGGILALLTAAAAAIFGKKEKQLTPTVQFYAPSGLNPAEIGYIIDKRADSRDITALIYYWASHGHITIEMTDKHHFTLHKLNELDDSHRSYEKTLYADVFKYGFGGSVTDIQLQEKLYTSINKATVSVCRVFTGSQSFTAKHTGLFSTALWLGVPALCLIGTAAAAKHWGGDAQAVFGTIMSALNAVLASLCMTSAIAKRYKGKFGIKVFFAIVLALAAVLWSFIIGGSSVGRTAGICMGTAMALCGLIAPFVRRRSDYYTDLLGVTVGFKEFLKTAEKDRLKTLLDENPDYYYDILPYAQVLGVSSQWLKRFDGLTIQPPTWFYGPYVTPYTATTMMNSSFNSMNRSMTSMPSSSGSGGGFGGGFSGGGGGFSGGGGGGGVGGW